MLVDVHNDGASRKPDTRARDEVDVYLLVTRDGEYFITKFVATNG